MKKLKKDILGLTGTGVLLGVGSTAVGKTGASTAAFSTAAGFMPLMGTTVGASAAMRSVKKLKLKKKRSRR